MKKYIGKKWINGNEICGWVFPDRKWAINFYKRKKSQLEEERKNENKITKLDDEDEWRYTRYDEENEYEEFIIHKKWKDVKNED